MIQPERTIDLVERQIAIARRNNQPRVLKKLEAELDEMKSKPFVRMVTTPAKRANMKTHYNAAAMAFYAAPGFKLD